MPRPSSIAVLAVAAFCGAGLLPLQTFAAEDDPAIAEGRALYLDYQCWQCHGYEGQGGAAPRVASRGYPFAAFERFVRFPNVMPVYPPGQLDDDNLQKIYAFVQSLPEPPGRDSIPALNID